MVLGLRIRKMKRLILHREDAGTRTIWKSHIKFLESKLNNK
ncbi:hypothetical protein [Clostridium botulinum]|nr:hypothetical protein [Clostridium botulinum]APH22988.1 hypothetical protein NPD1_706 [Clostridium botulinum]